MPPRRNRIRNTTTNVVTRNMPILTPQNIVPPVRTFTSNRVLGSDNAFLDGNPDHLNYFISQFKDEARLKDWSYNRLLQNIKKKLKGKAFDFMKQAQNIEDLKPSEELFEKLKYFFTPQSETHYFNALESLSMLPGESITHLAHRLNIFVH